MQGISEQELTNNSNGKVVLLPWVICALGALFYGYQYLLRVSPSVMISNLMFAYNIDTAALIGNLSAFYFYIYAPMQIPVGMLMDRFGTRRTLTLAAICCALGVYFFASSNSIILAEFGRFLIGFGSAFAFIGVLKLAILWLPEKRFGLITGVILSIGMIGGIIGEVVLSELIKIDGWRISYYLIACFGVVLALFMFLLLRRGAQRAGSKQIMLSSFRQIIAGLLITFKNPQIWINGFIGCLLYLPLSAFAGLWAVPYLQITYNFSEINAAGVVSLMFLGWALGAPVFGWISDTIKQRRILLTTGATFAAIFTAVIFYVPNLSHAAIGILFFLVGVFSSVEILVFTITKELSLKRVVGSTIGLTNTLIVISGLLFEPLIGYFLDLSWSGQQIDGVHLYTANDYQIALVIIPIALVMAVFLTFFLKESCFQEW